jgi:hypothetical protein
LLIEADPPVGRIHDNYSRRILGCSQSVAVAGKRRKGATLGTGHLRNQGKQLGSQDDVSDPDSGRIGVDALDKARQHCEGHSRVGSGKSAQMLTQRRQQEGSATAGRIRDKTRQGGVSLLLIEGQTRKLPEIVRKRLWRVMTTVASADTVGKRRYIPRPELKGSQAI